MFRERLITDILYYPNRDSTIPDGYRQRALELTTAFAKRMLEQNSYTKIDPLLIAGQRWTAPIMSFHHHAGYTGKSRPCGYLEIRRRPG